MTAAVSSSTVAAYVAPAAIVASSSDTDAATPSHPSSVATAAPPAPSQPNLAPGTVAALVAQQASDSNSGPATSTAASDASDASSSGAGSADNHVQIPPAVLDNMKAFQTTSPTAYTAQIQQYAATINDSKASDGDRFNAWTTLTGMLTSGTVYQAGNVADLQTALDATQTSGYAKGVMQLENQFHTTNVIDVDVARGKGQAAVQGMVDALNSYSDADQQKIFVLMGLNQQYSDVATLKADDQNIANIYASTGQLTKATMQLQVFGKVAPSLSTQATTTTAAASTTALSQAMASLTDPNASETAADVALTLLKNSAAAQAAAAKTNSAPADAKSTASSNGASASAADQNALTPSGAVIP